MLIIVSGIGSIDPEYFVVDIWKWQKRKCYYVTYARNKCATFLTAQQFVIMYFWAIYSRHQEPLVTHYIFIITLMFGSRCVNNLLLLFKQVAVIKVNFLFNFLVIIFNRTFATVNGLNGKRNEICFRK